jgi:branched-chain amino acid transport system ATP-binding protein
MSAVIQLCGLTRQFGGLAAVRNVTMAVEENEIRGLIGPNGAGKTTVLGLIGGQLKPSAGTVAFQGIDISRLRADQRAASGIRRTFQNLKLFPDMTVLENVMVGFHTQTHCEILQALLRTPAQHREERMVVEEGYRVLERVGLREQAAIPAGLLAYGHRRLLEVARALIGRPRLLLLDEPCAGLNSSEAHKFVHLIQSIQNDGVTIILVEHHMDVIMKACHRITVLNHGEMLAEGTPARVRESAEVREAYLGRGDLYQVIGHA